MTHESRMLIDGKLVESETGRQFDNVNPATEEVMGGTADGTRADMERAVARPAPPVSGNCRLRWRPSAKSCAASSSQRWGVRY